jgi:CBS domain-containing protein
MHPGVLTVAASASMADVARTMVVHGVHAVLVRPNDPRLVGWPSQVVTDRDLLRWVAVGEPPTTAADVASGPAALVGTEWRLERTARLMADLDEPHVLVASPRSPLPDGVLSSFDIAAVVGGRVPRAARLVRPAPARPALSERRLERVKVRAAMHHGVVGCAPGTSLTDVAAALADHRVHCVVVAGVDRAHPVWRVVDTMDVVCAASRWRPQLAAEDLRGEPPVTIDERATLRAAAELMDERGLSHLVVIDKAGAPTGVVSSIDVAAVCAIT